MTFLQDKLYQEDYEKCSTEEERTQLQANFSAASDWLYEQDETVERKVRAQISLATSQQTSN